MPMNEKLATGDLLSGLRHSQVTDLKREQINNHDAALLIIASSESGTARSGDVIWRLQHWRSSLPGGMSSGNRRPNGGVLAFTYLWNTSEYGGYGFVGKDVNSVFNNVYHHSSGSRGTDCETRRRTYWYRVRRGHYRLTLEGFRRLGELTESL